MKFSDEGIIISQKKYGENSLIVKVFSHHHGIYCGFVKSTKSTKNRSIFQIGNLISFEFRNRVEENLGQFFAVDLIKSYGTKIIFDRLKLDCMNSIFSIIDSAFLERENHQNLFLYLENFLQKILDENILPKVFLSDYVRLELKILENLGYAIDLSSCVVTDSKFDLAFVSPKSARAVSFSVGKVYEKKLLKLPNFLIDENAEYDLEHIAEGMILSGFFLEKFLFEGKSKSRQYFFHRENIKKIVNRF